MAGTLTLPEITIYGIPAVTLFSRASRVTVGNVQITNIGQQKGLDVWFSVKRSLKAGEPNTADLKIWNLSDTSRKSLEQSAQPLPSVASAPGAPNTVVPVKIEAGYVGHMSTLFLGEMRSAQTVRDGDDLVTELQTGDGDEAQAVARATMPLGPTNAYTVAQRLLGAMGCGAGNLASVADALRSLPLYAQGGSIKGAPHDRLLDLCASAGLEFSIQGGQAQFLSLGQPLPGSAYELSSGTGLIGNPSVDTEGVLTCETLLLPGIKPGDPILMNEPPIVQGLYRVTSITTVGDTAGNDWSHKIEAKRPGIAP